MIPLILIFELFFAEPSKEENENNNNPIYVNLGYVHVSSYTIL